MGLKVWSEDCLEAHRAGEHALVSCADCYPCHIGAVKFNTHTLRFWNKSKDSANEIATDVVKTAKEENREIIGGQRWT